MTIETSTVNALLLAILSLQCWIVHELFKLKTKTSIIIALCKQCPKNSELDTDQLLKAK
jgi:hypothetical protein